ncbi:hypothetical protein DVS77_26570 [Mycolicibacterium moriokaense]|nr:hypothetical protein DVS77_26570 [Mycolicibacterium moriokaense]
MLAVPRPDVGAELLRIQIAPVKDAYVRGLVDSVLERADGVPLQRNADTGQLSNVVMAGWGNGGQVDSEHAHALAEFIRTLVEGLSDQQLVTAATELGITENDVNYFGRTAYEEEAGEDGRPRMVGAIISRRPGASAEVRAHAERAAARVREHLRDRSGKTWDDYDRKVLREIVLNAFARLGDAYLKASDSLEVRGLTWRRLPDGSLRADTAGPDGNTVSVLLEALNEDEDEIVAGLEPEMYTEFYPTGRSRRAQTYLCYVGIFDEDDRESDVGAESFEELYSSGPHGQLDGQRTAIEVLAEVLADA